MSRIPSAAAGAAAGAAPGAAAGAALLDVNVLIALAWPNHVAHAEAPGWFKGYSGKKWATCPMTQSAFVRISSNPSIIRVAATPRDALAKLSEITARPGHVFWADDLPLEGLLPEIAASIVGHRQMTDAYLLGLSISHQGKLVTLDGGIRELLPMGNPHHRSVILIGA